MERQVISNAQLETLEYIRSGYLTTCIFDNHVFLHSYNNRYSNKNKRFELSEVVLSAWIEYRNINLRSSYFNTLTNLSRPKLPLISAVKSNTALQSTAADKDQREQQQPYIYWQQGRDTLLRIVQTGKGIEGQSITRAHIHSLVSIILPFCYQTLLLQLQKFVLHTHTLLQRNNEAIFFAIFFPRFILYIFFSFLLIYGGSGVGVLNWVFGVFVFS